MKSDNVYGKTKRQVQKEYNDALERSIKKNREYLSKVKQVQDGTIKPPSGLKTDGQIEAWKRGYLRRYLDRTNLVRNTVEELETAGGKCRKKIRTGMDKMYGVEHGSVVSALKAGKLIAPTTERQARVLLDGKLNSFDIKALENLSDGKTAKKRLQREMAVSILKGEDDKAVLNRLRTVVGMEESHAMTVLRTERTRVIGMAQQDAADEYERKTGRVPKKKWICSFKNSRDSHMDLNGTIVNADEEFVPGLAFPGDPHAPAIETVNCQCYMEIFDE